MKLDRLLSITMALLNQTRISAAALAEQYEVSLRTIYRDMETINQAGIPIVSFPGADGGYEIMPNYRVDKQFLSLEDFLSISTALRGVQSVLDNQSITSLIDKFGALKSDSTQQTDSISMDLNLTPSNKEKDKITPLHQAVRETRIVQFEYMDIGGNETTRIIEPMGLYLRRYIWYVYGFCLKRKDLRTFRLSRINQLKLLSETFIRRNYTLEDVAHNRNVSDRPNPFNVSLLFKPTMKTTVRDTFDYALIEALPDDFTRVIAQYYSVEHAVQNILSFNTHVIVSEPPEVVNELRLRIAELAEIYEVKI